MLSDHRLQQTTLDAIVMIAFAILLGTLISSGTTASQADQITWNVPIELLPTDRSAILDLARQAGIDYPETVSMPVTSPCPLLRVESRPVIEGNRLSTKILSVRQATGPGCQNGRTDLEVQRSGNWLAVRFERNPETKERWRIRDGDWYIDVFFSGNVPYDDARAMVLAIRRRALVDRRTGEGADRPMPDIDPNRITRILGGGARDDGPAYSVQKGENLGWELGMTVQNDRVELVSALQYLT